MFGDTSFGAGFQFTTFCFQHETTDEQAPGEVFPRSKVSFSVFDFPLAEVERRGSWREKEGSWKSMSRLWEMTIFEVEPTGLFWRTRDGSFKSGQKSRNTKDVVSLLTPFEIYIPFFSIAVTDDSRLGRGFRGGSF